jgi:hypothetical protein
VMPSTNPWNSAACQLAWLPFEYAPGCANSTDAVARFVDLSGLEVHVEGHGSGDGLKCAGLPPQAMNVTSRATQVASAHSRRAVSFTLQPGKTRINVSLRRIPLHARSCAPNSYGLDSAIIRNPSMHMGSRDNPLTDDRMRELRRIQHSRSRSRSLTGFLLFPHPIIDLLPMHGYSLRRIDAHPDVTPFYGEDRNCHLVTNHYDLAYLTCQHKHGSILP